MSAGLNIDRDGAVLTLTINRPERRNALDNATYAALTAAGAGVGRRVRVGGHPDRRRRALHRRQRPARFAERGAGDSAAMSFLRALTTTDVPVIAAVEGYAVGIGVTLLQHCDFVHIGEGATLRLPFVALGLCPEGASSLLLPRLAGARRAAEWLLQGRPSAPARRWKPGWPPRSRPPAGAGGGPGPRRPIWRPSRRAAADQGHAQAPGPRGHPGHAGL